MFIDHVSITLSSGKGGAGAVSFRREKHVIQGGPDGGDGGRGGDVYFLVDNNSHTLANYQGKNHLKAKNGHPGEGRKKYGKKGEDLILPVPPGTQIIDKKTGEILLDLVCENQKIIFLKGGMGGLGNSHFKSATNQRPTYAQSGEEAKSVEIIMELQSIADVGLVGFPNVGKSTLISTISNATPEIANYEFTTLTPKLGKVNIDEYSSFILADIPGIIKGASLGKGLGIKFLQHIQRTRVLLLMLDLAYHKSLHEQYQTLREELKNYSEKLSKKKFAIALTRYDALSSDEAEEKIQEFFEYLSLKKSEAKFNANKNIPCYFGEDIGFILPISSVAGFNIPSLKYALFNLVQSLRNEDKNEQNEEEI